MQQTKHIIKTTIAILTQFYRLQYREKQFWTGEG